MAAIPARSRRITVIGGGIIGLALAYKLSRNPRLAVCLLEKEVEVGQHQSGHNSGVLHSGLYYRPGSLKARLAVSGIRQMKQFCTDHEIPHEECGKLVVACSDDEIPRLKSLLERGRENGLRDLRWLERAAMLEIEPHAGGLAAVQVPEEGIVDYKAVCARLQSLVEAAGGVVHTSWPVTSIEADGKAWRIGGPAGQIESDYFFNCAGLHCDRILAMAGERRTTRIVPFRGEYFELNQEGRKLVRNLIYPVPDPRFPFLGVHFTRMIRGGVEAGPNAVLAMAREGYRKTDFRAADLGDVLTYGGFWRFLGRYPSMCTYELWRSVSKTAFCRSLQRLVPEIEQRHLATGGAGVRAQALGEDGVPIQDFECVTRETATHLINAPSPGATASLSIADYLVGNAGMAYDSGDGNSMTVLGVP